MFHGSMVALVTPMQPSGEIDFHSLRQLIDWQVKAGTQAILVGGITGEFAALTSKELHLLARTAVEYAQERIAVIAAAGAGSTAEAIKLASSIQHEGVDAFLNMAPGYIRPTQEGLYRHYCMTAEKVPLPQIIHNAPERSGCDILPATIERIAQHANIIGVKEDTPDITRGKQLLQICGENIDIYCGYDPLAKELMLLGAKGVISIAANLAPRHMYLMSQAALRKDIDQAETLNNELAELYEALALEINPIPIKWALAEKGWIKEGIRLPLTPLSTEFHQKIKNILIRFEEKI